MFNVLPHNFKDVIKKKYAYRRTILWMCAGVVLECLYILLLVPSYISIRAQENDMVVSVAPQTVTTAQQDSQTAQIFKDVNKKIALLASFPSTKYTHDLVSEIISLKGASVNIKEIMFQSSTATSSTVSVTGVAIDRESLLAFSKKLESDPLFDTVNLPVSNFAKDKNIQFSLTMNANISTN